MSIHHHNTSTKQSLTDDADGNKWRFEIQCFLVYFFVFFLCTESGTHHMRAALIHNAVASLIVGPLSLHAVHNFKSRRSKKSVTKIIKHVKEPQPQKVSKIEIKISQNTGHGQGKTILILT